MKQWLLITFPPAAAAGLQLVLLLYTISRRLVTSGYNVLANSGMGIIATASLGGGSSGDDDTAIRETTATQSKKARRVCLNG